MLQPSEITFDIKKGTSEWDGKTPVVAIFLMTKDDDHEESDNLGRHNVAGLPDILGSEVMECSFEVRGGDFEDIKAQMISAGFTHRQMENW